MQLQCNPCENRISCGSYNDPNLTTFHFFPCFSSYQKMKHFSFHPGSWCILLAYRINYFIPLFLLPCCFRMALLFSHSTQNLPILFYVVLAPTFSSYITKKNDFSFKLFWSFCLVIIVQLLLFSFAFFNDDTSDKLILFRSSHPCLFCAC